MWAFASILLRRRHFIVVAALSLAIAVAAFTLLRPREYRATASFVPQEPTQVQAGIGQLAAQFGLAAPRASSGSPAFYAELVQSRELLRDVILTHYNAPGAYGLNGNLIHYFKMDRDSDAYTMSRAIEKLRSLLNVETDRGTGIVSFEIHLRNPRLAEAVAERTLNLVNEYNMQRRQSQARSEREFVQQRLQDAKRDLAGAEQQLANFHSGNRRFESPYLQAQEDRLQREVTLRQDVVTSLSQNFETARIDEVRTTPVINVIEKPDGFVEPQRRGTVQKTIVAFFAGLILGVALAVIREYLTRAAHGRQSDYTEFEQLWHETLSELRRPWRRRRVAAHV